MIRRLEREFEEYGPLRDNYLYVDEEETRKAAFFGGVAALLYTAGLDPLTIACGIGVVVLIHAGPEPLQRVAAAVDRVAQRLDLNSLPF